MALVAFAPLPADQHYRLTGEDSYQVGEASATVIAYRGTQTLHVTKSGRSTRFVANVRYVRSGDGGDSAPRRASFEQEMSPQGGLQDRSNHDPDYLTVLNQPFAIELDDQTLHDLLHLSGQVPFDFPSPITGGALHGYLQRSVVGRVAARRAVGITFDARGPMIGPLPGHPQISIEGTMRMNGTAFYAVRGALLLALDETLTIKGTLRDRSNATPVTIIYKRSIKADEDAPDMTEASGPG